MLKFQAQFINPSTYNPPPPPPKKSPMCFLWSILPLSEVIILIAINTQDIAPETLEFDFIEGISGVGCITVKSLKTE